MPTAAEIPRIDLLVSEQAPAPGNPLGVRGAGEGGITAAGATLASAVRDALGGSQDVSALPLTPARVRAMAEAAPPAHHGRRARARPLSRPGTRAGKPL
jgi:carbon-monoxide dehydrogenase large subunit/6-hydroxypseudooxynicotine dehydrogenase subunit gamma